MIDLSSFISLPSWLLFLIIVGGSVGLACSAVWLVRTRMEVAIDSSGNEVVAPIFGIISTLYAVLLAFLIVIVWQDYHAARLATSDEATAIVTLARTSTALPEPARTEVRTRLRHYTELVLNDEWPAMHQGKAVAIASPAALADINALWALYQQEISPTASNSSFITLLDELSRQRALRLLSSTGDLPGPFWFVLVIGAVIMAGCFIFFYTQSVGLHLFMMAVLIGMTAMGLWLIVLINNPFVGDIQVPPDAFTYALRVIETLPR